MPDGSQATWVNYNVALYNFTRAVMLIQEAEIHPEDQELFQFTLANVGPIQEQFAQATSALRDWMDSANRRVNKVTKSIA